MLITWFPYKISDLVVNNGYLYIISKLILIGFFYYSSKFIDFDLSLKKIFPI